VDSLYQFELVRSNWIISLSRSQRYTSCEDIHVVIRGGTFPIMRTFEKLRSTDQKESVVKMEHSTVVL
jgi:hypothetical protein